MATFSAVQAIGSGFQLIRREPKAILIWIVAYAAFAAVTYGLMFAAMPEILGYYQEMARAGLEGGQPDETLALSLGSRMLAIAPLLMLVALVAYAVMLGAVYRAVLHPEDRRFAYLRFGRGELWLMLTLLVLAIFLTIVYVALAVLFGVIGAVIGGVAAGVGGADANPAAIMGPVFVGILVVWVVMLLIALRLCLALPMSHDQQRFVMFESWRITRGQTLKMFGVAVALFLIMCLFEIIVFALVAVVMIAAMGGGGVEAFVAADTQALAGRLFPWLPVLALVASAVGVLMYTVMIAPWADIYRQLTRGEAAA